MSSRRDYIDRVTHEALPAVGEAFTTQSRAAAQVRIADACACQTDEVPA